ncbi:MAG: EAL domain-containing protein [Thiovulaceae bacterium]|nr:EAL domain-containing protein [Sulfurimonadaceae bacterium]
MKNKKNLSLNHLEREQNARRQADILLEQKSLELWEANRQLQSSVDAKTDELQKLKEQLSITFEDNSQELVAKIQLLDEYKKAVDQSTIVSMADTHGFITYVNSAFVQVSCYSADELIGQPHNIIRHPDSPPELFKVLWETILSKQPWHGVIKNRAKDGSVYYVDTTISPILGKKGEIEKFIALRYDITKVIEQEKHITRHLTNRLTGLPNRLKLIEDLESGRYVAMGVLNLDAFQELNNLYGHKIGDEVLKTFAAYLTENLNKENCSLYKLPSDEFAILSRASCDEETCKSVIAPLIQKLDSHMFHIGEHEIYLSMTVGMSYGSGTEMLINANIALKNAKEEKLPFAFYDPEKHEKEDCASKQEMVKTLKYALAHDLVIPFFQPIYNNKTHKIDKYETLMRIINEKGELLSPYLFLDIAHKAKIYPELTKTLLRKAFAMFHDKDIAFTVNLSVEDIRNSATNAYIFDMLGSFEKPHNVVFEIIESEGIDNYAMVKEFVQEVEKYGARISIDDFGSGYSNFMHLLELNTSFIKIDGSIIKNILHDRNSQILTKTIVSMAKELDMEVVAEFVSSHEIHEAVLLLGVDHSQGYYFGEPRPYLLSK